ncbi:MAG TPA: lactonase family protein [Kribbellaceae bacterium]|nr:lactonase family protein [Kribbellaceae bacterium]
MSAYLGGYTSQHGGGDGIALADLEACTARTVAEVPDPSYLALSSDGRFLYECHETSEGKVGAYAMQDDGTLEPLGRQSSHGEHPCHLAVHPRGEFLLSANYSSGSIAVHPIAADGSLGEAVQVVQHSGSGPNKERQDGPKAHMVACDPVEEFVFAVDLGTDSVYVYTFDLGTGQLTERSRLALAPGAGPRHIAFQPDWLTAYVLTELDSTLVVCDWDPEKAELTALETMSSRADGAEGENFPAAIRISDDGRFIYTSNRGDDTIAVFATHEEGRRVEQVQVIPSGGSWPRDLALSADGSELYATNERADLVTSFAVDPADGRLTRTGKDLSWPKPVCILPV